MTNRLKAVALGAAAFAGRSVRSLPGIAAIACTFAGVWSLFGIGWALLAVVPFLLAMDRSLR